MAIDKEKLTQFTSKALKLAPPSLLPWAGITSDSDVIYSLKKQVVEFAKLYIDPNARLADIDKLAAELEATLLTQQAVAPQLRHTSDELIDQLRDLVDNRTI